MTENIFDVSAPASSAYYDVKKLFNHRTEYVGDNSKVVNIASSLAYPDGSTYDSVVLHTDARPYGVEVHLNVDAAGKEDEFYQARFIAFRERAELLFALIGNLDRVDFVLNGKRDIRRTCFVEEAAHFSYSLQWRDALPADYGLIADSYDSTATLIDAYDFIEDSSSYYFEYDPDEANQPKDEDDELIDVDEEAESENGQPTEIAQFVEQRLNAIMSSPQSSSIPADYISAHQREYEEILKRGDEAFDYMISEFEKGNGSGLKGFLMALASRDIRGSHEPIEDGYNWYIKHGVSQKIDLPDYVYQGDDAALALISKVANANGDAHFETGSFKVLTGQVLKTVSEGDVTKLFARLKDDRYKLYGDIIVSTGGQVMTIAISYQNDAQSGRPQIVETQLYDPKKIETFDNMISVDADELCTLPLSGKAIANLKQEIIFNSSQSEISRQSLRNLERHLRANGITKAVLYNYSGEVELSIGE